MKSISTTTEKPKENETRNLTKKEESSTQSNNECPVPRVSLAASVLKFIQNHF